ncbi:MAG: flagellar basal body P-ring formation chaperone FlgA [Pseudomonadota bacterium]
MRALIILALLIGSTVWADTVVPTRTIRANAVISEKDVMLRAGLDVTSGLRMEDVLGQEARVVLYPGRPIRADDIGPPAVVQRNQTVRVHFNANGVQISTEGRALERGGVGDLVRVMNLSSRATLFGQVRGDGSIQVNP